jgi:aryl-alcohol dehydrogenase-like predicted oxidoreductase
LIGNWLAKNPSKRADITLCTKIGFNRQPTDDFLSGPCSDPAYLPIAVESALSQLQTHYIDVLFQHRVDPKVPIEIVLEALRPAVEAGKVKYLGLSECSADTLRRARAVKGIGEKVVVVQMEYSPFTVDAEREGGIAGVCEELGVSFVAYSPLGRGMVSGR